MTQAEPSSGLYQEREALLDRIRFYESSARHFNNDRGARIVGITEAHMAYAKARLEHIDNEIACLEHAAHAMQDSSGQERSEDTILVVQIVTGVPSGQRHISRHGA